MNETLTRFERTAPAGSDLPVLITPSSSGQLLTDAAADLRHRIDEALMLAGGVLLRDFAVPTVESFQQFAASFGHALLKYEFASTPRSAVSATGVYTSTEYPAHQHIPLHNEQAYTREWPMKIWFHCVTASPVGGETPIADSRAIHLEGKVVNEVAKIWRSGDGQICRSAVRFRPSRRTPRSSATARLTWREVVNPRADTRDRASAAAPAAR